MDQFVRHIALLLGLLASFSTWAQSGLFEHFGRDEGLGDVQVYDVNLSPEGNLWLATSDGISTFNGLLFEHLESPKSQASFEVIGLESDVNGTTWCYTSNSQVYSLVKGRFLGIAANRTLKEKLNGKIINQMHITYTGHIYLSTVIGGGLYRFHPDSTAVEEVKLDEGDYGFYVRELDDGALICGSRSSNTGKNKLRVMLKENNSFELSLSAEGNFSRSTVVRMANGSILYGKEHEAVNFDASTVLSRAFLENTIEQVYQDSDGKIWITFNQGGVNCYPDGTIGPNIELQYLSDRTVSGLAEDPSGNMWISTSNEGIYFMPSRPQVTYSPPKVFTDTKNDPLDEQPSQTGITVHSDLPKRAESVSSIETFRVDTIPPVVYISGVRIRERDTAVKEFYDLPYDFTFMKIRYVGFASGNPEGMQYRYKLEGLSDDWVYTSGTEAQFTSLDPGEYKFTLMAMNKFGYWSTVPAKVGIRVHPPIWQTWWFRTTIGTLLLALIAGLVFGYVWRIRSRERERAAVQQKLAKVELQALRAQMNPHFMFNTLSSIQHYITINDTEPALRYLSKFAKLMRRIIENSKKAVISLKDEIDALELYLQLESLRFKDKFDYQIKVDKSVDPNYDMIPSMLIQPYVENAILHGLTRKEKDGLLTITLEREDNLILCQIEDNGIGRAASAEINKARVKTHKSRGLSITQERLKILNTANNSPLSVEIIDLADEQGNASGTRVKIFIPAGR